MSIHIVLVEPEIPQNTGNIARTCAATGASLHLVEPLGFSTADRYLKRAGLDYWRLLEVSYYPNLDTYLTANTGRQIVLATTRASRPYTDTEYGQDCALVFGKETEGLPAALLAAHPDWCVRLPMRSEVRSLNLSNAAAILVYEVLRRQGFPDLS